MVLSWCRVLGVMRVVPGIIFGLLAWIAGIPRRLERSAIGILLSIPSFRDVLRLGRCLSSRSSDKMIRPVHFDLAHLLAKYYFI